MARLLSRAFPPGLFMIALGIVLVGLGAVLDHYGMRRSEWYAGEAGMILLCIGSVTAFAAVVAILFQADNSGTASGGDGDRDG